jgi:uncharacterized protein YndB with AHSA1/START domain
MDGRTFGYDAEYIDIVPDQRIVYTYAMQVDGEPDSFSIVTVELEEQPAGTAMTYTEQGVFLDGIDDPAERERGTTDLLDNLGRYLAMH